MFSRRVLACNILVFFIVSGIAAFGPVGRASGEMNKGSITGQIMIRDGGPMSGEVVWFFNKAIGPPPDMTKYFRVPDERFFLDSDGRFTAEVPEGHYYIIALKKISGERGTLEDGDLLFVDQDEKGRLKEYAVKKGEKLDIGVLSKVTAYNKGMLAKEGLTAIEGTVLDETGKPVEGAMVFARPEAGRPSFITNNKTLKDGKYLLRVPQGGNYHLWVWDANYSGESSAAVKTGEIIRGLDIKVKRFSGGDQK